MKVEILVTGPELVGKGIRGIEPVIEEIINEASSEIHIMVYLLKPSALKILKLLERAAERGVRVSMVINNLGIQDPRVVAMLRSIAQRFPHFKVVDFRDPRGAQLHAKVIVADRKRAVVGSCESFVGRHVLKLRGRPINRGGNRLGNYQLSLIIWRSGRHPPPILTCN
jgi:cardiolipin synthase